MKFNIITTSILTIILYFGTSNAMTNWDKEGYTLRYYIAQDNVDKVKNVFAKQKNLTPQSRFIYSTLEEHAEKFKACKVLEFFKQWQALVVYGSYKNVHDILAEINSGYEIAVGDYTPFLDID